MNVELRRICKSFGSVRANHEVSLMVAAGSIHGLLGENGAGKSTLVKVLSGFIACDRGEIILNGQGARIDHPDRAIQAGIGMLHQDPLDVPPLTVLENFMLGRSRGFWLNRRRAARQLRQLSEGLQFRLDPDEMASNLTVGERQQLELVRLLSLGVETLILDEPTTGISAAQKTLLFAALKQLAKTEGKSVLFVSHKLEDVEELCDRVTVMRRGEVVGEAEIPCPAATLVSMMFEKELAAPTKPPTKSEAVALDLQGVALSDRRLDVTIGDLTVHEGEVIGLAGLEGSGQQLLLQACAGILHPLAGRMAIAGTDVTHKPYREFLRLGVGYVPADRLKEGLIGGLTIREHVALRSQQRDMFVDWQQAQKDCQYAIDFFNIRGTPRSLVEKLSGGNQQRTQLALLPVPLNLLLMEHPTRGLDIESALWVWQQLIARCQGGTAILFMSSDLDELMQYSDRIVVFSGGRVSPPLEVASLTVERLGQMMGGKFNETFNETDATVTPGTMP